MNLQAVYEVDETRDRVGVGLTDFGGPRARGASTPETERFDTYKHCAPARTSANSSARKGEVWGAESGADRLVVARY